MEPINLLDLKPRRTVTWETGENQSVTLVVPKFRNAFLRKWLLPVLARPNFRVRLDDFGSFVWLCCDGSATVAGIAESLSGRFGAAVEPLYDRLENYLKKLEREGFITLINQAGGQVRDQSS